MVYLKRIGLVDAEGSCGVRETDASHLEVESDKLEARVFSGGVWLGDGEESVRLRIWRRKTLEGNGIQWKAVEDDSTVHSEGQRHWKSLEVEYIWCGSPSSKHSPLMASSNLAMDSAALSVVTSVVETTGILVESLALDVDSRRVSAASMALALWVREIGG